jgi:two-component system sensor kinase FixL
MTKPLSSQLTLAATVALAGAIFCVDLVTVLGVSVPTLYLTVLLLATRSPARLLSTAAGCSLLTLLGAFLSPPGLSVHIGWTNRAITLAAIWLAAGMLAGRARAQRDLQQSEAQKRLLLDRLPDGVLIIQDLRVVFANPTAVRLLHASCEDELIGESPMHFLDHASQGILRQHLDAPSPPLELRALRLDGQSLPIDAQITPLSYQGRPAVQAVFRDISQRKHAEAEAQRQGDWLRGLIQATQDAVVSIDRHGRIVLFNPAAERIFGYARQEVSGRPVQVLMPEPYRSEHDAYLSRYERTGQARAIGRIRTVTAQRKDGSTFPIELSVTEITADSDVHYAAFIRDISDKVQMQERLLERERLATIGTTAAKLAHEIGNPLNGMSLAVQILKRRVARHGGVVAEQFTPHVLSLTGSISRLIQLLQEFRSLSRRQRFVFQALSLTSLIDEVLSAEGPGYAAQGVEVEHETRGDGVPPVQGDRDKLRQVLLNLCKNAVEAMPQGGKLIVSAQEVGEQVLLTVADTGSGIPDGVDVFEPFVTTKEHGTGLGLPVVQQIIDAHGGVIRYVSTPGKGTTFTVALPRGDGLSVPRRLPAQG